MIIHTHRCTIRPFAEQDLDDFMTYRNNMEWMKYQGFKGLTKEEYKSALLSHFSIEKGGQLAIISNELSTIIGDIYVKSEEDFFWIGYTINPLKARQGYAFEAVSALINTLKDKGAKFIKAGAESGNTASIALLKKLNFEHLETMDDEEIFILKL